MATLLAAGVAAYSALGFGGTAAIAGGAAAAGATGVAISASKQRKKQRDIQNLQGEQAQVKQQKQVEAEKISRDEDLRRQRLFQKPVLDEEEIQQKRKQLLGQ